MGTGGIPEQAVIAPARSVPEVLVEAVGSRSTERGREYATKHGIPKVLDYEAMIRDPAIDIIYIALPISLHAEWSLKALAAGKHVLCEKSMTANAVEAAQVAQAVRQSRRVYMEAYAYPYHPFAKRVREILDMRAIGTVKSVDATLGFPAQRMRANSIRRQFETGGGVLLDLGCYAVRALCDYLGPVERVVTAKADVASDDAQVDLEVAATLQFAGGRQGRLLTSFKAEEAVKSTVIRGDAGTLTIESLNAPHQDAWLRLDWDGGSYTEKADGTSSYLFQMQELVRCVRDGAPVTTSADNGLIVMQAMDAIYKKAGLKLRGAM